jgi:hypothetical protein
MKGEYFEFIKKITINNRTYTLVHPHHHTVTLFSKNNIPLASIAVVPMEEDVESYCVPEGLTYHYHFNKNCTFKFVITNLLSSEAYVKIDISPRNKAISETDEGLRINEDNEVKPHQSIDVIETKAFVRFLNSHHEECDYSFYVSVVSENKQLFEDSYWCQMEHFVLCGPFFKEDGVCKFGALWEEGPRKYEYDVASNQDGRLLQLQISIDEDFKKPEEEEGDTSLNEFFADVITFHENNNLI